MSMTERVWKKVYRIDAHTRRDGKCCYCRTPVPLSEVTAEHRTPRKLGGRTTRENIDAACSPCNNARRHLTRAEFMRAIHEPDYRRDPWPLYEACMLIRLRLRTAAACRRLRLIVEPRVAAR
jgi:5-methylcytosine-specific restriction endonuclease McrA